MPLMPHNLLATFLKKSSSVARNIWKNRELVSEIPRGRRNRTKNILERALDVPKRGTIKPPNRGGAGEDGAIKQGVKRVALRQHSLREVGSGIKRKQTPFEGLPLCMVGWLEKKALW